MHYTSLLSTLSRSLAAVFALFFIGQTVVIQIAVADATRLLEQGRGSIKAVKIRPFFRPEIERPEDSPLLNAVRRNDLPIIQKLINSGAELNIVNNQQFTPLKVAVLLGNDEVVKKLIAAGVDVNFPDKPINVVYEPPRLNGKNLTGSKVRSASRGANRNKRIRLDPISPLSCAIDQSNENLAILLIENGASFNTTESKGEGPEYPLQRILAKGLYEAADRMLAGTTTDQRQQIIDSLLIWSVGSVKGKNKIPIINFLIGKGSRFEIFDMKGTTPLVAAVIDGNLEIVKFLLDMGAQVDTPVKSMGKYQDAGSTPLIFSMMRLSYSSRREEKDTSIIRLLLLRGADTNRKNQNKMSAVHYLPVSADGLELIKLFHAHGADLDQQNEFGETLLKKALDQKSVEVARFLLEKGADINSDRMNINGYMHRNDIATIDFLLANNFDLNRQKTDIFSRKVSLPLIYACEKGKADYVEKLIAHGAEVNPESSQGDIPLYSAIKSGNLDIVKILLDNGADINYQKKDGINAFVLASVSGRKDIADYLKSRGADTSGFISDSKIFFPLKQAGLIPEEIEWVSKKQLKFLKLMLQQELGIASLNDLKNPDPRFSSPEKTWELYKNALIDGELELAAQCHLLKNDQHIEMYKALGVEKTSVIGRNFCPIEKVTGDEQRSKYRIKRNINDKDITFYIYFYNVFGEWKIEQF